MAQFLKLRKISASTWYLNLRGGELAGMQPLGVVHYSSLQLSHWDLRAGAP